MTDLTISQIEHFVKLNLKVNGLVNKTTKFSQIDKCPSQ
jgi:hypothetical protein